MSLSLKLLAFVVLAASSAFVHASTASPEEGSIRDPAIHDHSILVFTKTGSFRHANIPVAVEAIKQLGEGRLFSVEWTEDSAIFADSSLARFNAVVFLNTTGDILSPSQQGAFERYIENGGGFVGIHSAADTEREWGWYEGLVGAYLRGHTQIQSGTILVGDRSHPSTSSLSHRWTKVDEWYNFEESPRGKVHVLATVDGRSISGGEHPADHPISWCHLYRGGRSWYTALGHTEESFSDPQFLEHIVGGIRFAAGIAAADCGATVESNYQKIILDDTPQNPMELAVAPDGRVFFVELYGAVKLYDPQAERTRTIGELNVFHQFEDGLVGITLDPDFDQNGLIYLFYSPAGNEAIQRVSRFAFDGTMLDLTSEKTLLEIPTQREQCCHTSGSLKFGPDGNLFISTGDNTNPFESHGYAPIDERDGRAPWDAQKSSGNTNDLRGKILRITPETDGTYSIPEGNLFTEDELLTRPEIYAMGLRNPFRISVDHETGWLYWGDVGPDAGPPDPLRGPRSYDEWNRAKGPGNYGWPYCVADNKPYVDYDFETAVSGVSFDCSAPVNDSPNNTGMRRLPPAQEPLIWYPYGKPEEFPEIDGGGAGRTAAAGPIYHYDFSLRSAVKLPSYFDGTLFIYEWSRNWIKEVKFDENGEILMIAPFLPSLDLTSPIEMEVGPDGALYVLEWGSDKFGRNNTDAKLVKIEYNPGNSSPVAILSAEPTAGSIPLMVHFDAGTSYDPDSYDQLVFEWDFTESGQVQASGPAQTYTFTEPGVYDVRVEVRDARGATDVTSVRVVAGNSRPKVSIEQPEEGAFFDWGATVEYRVTITDAEDGSTEAGDINCERVKVHPSVGHNDHSHGERIYSGCTGSVELSASHGTGGSDVYYVIEATYEDKGATNVIPLTGRSVIVLQPRNKQAEHFDLSDGVEIVRTDEAFGQAAVSSIKSGDYLTLYPANLRNIETVKYRLRPSVPGTEISIHADSTSGLQVSSVRVPEGSVSNEFVDLIAPVRDAGGTRAYHVVFRNPDLKGGLGMVDEVEFGGEGLTRPIRNQLSDVYLYAPFPNPASASVQFQYAIADAATVRLDISSMLGRRVARLVEREQSPGLHTVAFSTNHLASGVYVLRLTVAGKRIVRKFVIAR